MPEDKISKRRRERRERIAEYYRNLVRDYMKAREAKDVAKKGILIHGVCMFGNALEMADPNGKWFSRRNKIWEECEQEIRENKNVTAGLETRS